jgi:hypothetical protein
MFTRAWYWFLSWDTWSVHRLPSHFFSKFILVITFPSTFRSSKHFLSLRFHTQILLSYECYIFHPQYLPRLHRRKNIWQDLLVGKLFICLQFSKNFYNSVLIKSLKQIFLYSQTVGSTLPFQLVKSTSCEDRRYVIFSHLSLPPASLQYPPWMLEFTFNLLYSTSYEMDQHV